MKQRMIKAGIRLFLMMILFTVLSRTAYNLSTAGVTTEKASAQTFAPDVSAQGVVTGRREIAVSAAEGIRIGSVDVAEGQTVKKGETLFRLDRKDLAKKMKEKQQELFALDLQIQGAQEAESLSQQNQELLWQQAQEDYSRAAGREDTAVDIALSELTKAQKKYQKYIEEKDKSTGQNKQRKQKTEREEAEQKERPEKKGQTEQKAQTEQKTGTEDQTAEEQKEEELLQTVEEKEAAYDQAVRAREDSLYEAQKAIDSAGIGTAKDYSVEQMQITRSQREEEYAELKELYDVQGRIKAPVKGMVTGVSVQAGSTATGGGDILLSDASRGVSLRVTFPGELGRYVKEGSQAVVAAADGSGSSADVTERVKIKAVTVQNGVSGDDAQESAPDMAPEDGTESGVEAFVNLKSEHFSAGETVTLRVEAQARDYDTCIPIGALHLKSGGQYYVNVAEKKSAVLGEEWVVRQVTVELLDRNDKYAAVEGISSDQEVVTESSRMLEDGSRVKKENEAE